MRKIFFFTFFLWFAGWLPAQDILYTITGNKITAKVLELNLKDVKYKDFANVDGPTYVISKTEIVLICFSDGSVQIINKNPPVLQPKSTEVQTKKINEKKKKLNLYYLNKNLISINALALCNGDVTLIYDRDLLDSRLCISFLGGYNFNPRMVYLNNPIIDGVGYGKKKYDSGLGVSFMPRNTRRVQYFVGVLTKYMTYDFNDITMVNGQSLSTVKQGSQFALMISNGWFYRITPNFNFKLFASLGAPVYQNNGSVKRPTYAPKMYLGYCFGYRF